MKLYLTYDEVYNWLDTCELLWSLNLESVLWKYNSIVYELTQETGIEGRDITDDIRLDVIQLELEIQRLSSEVQTTEYYIDLPEDQIMMFKLARR